MKLPPTHPLFVGGWNPVERLTTRPPRCAKIPSLEYPEFYGLFIDGRLAVVYSPLDLMSGVNRESNAYAKGVSSDDAPAAGRPTVITYALSN